MKKLIYVLLVTAILTIITSLAKAEVSYNDRYNNCVTNSDTRGIMGKIQAESKCSAEVEKELAFDYCFTLKAMGKNIYRCENKEVICYIVNGYREESITCNFKGK